MPRRKGESITDTQTLAGSILSIFSADATRRSAIDRLAWLINAGPVSLTALVSAADTKTTIAALRKALSKTIIQIILPCALLYSENQMCWHILQNTYSQIHPGKPQLKPSHIPLVLSHEKDLTISNLMAALIAIGGEGITSIVVLLDRPELLSIDHSGDLLVSLFKAPQSYSISKSVTGESVFPISISFVAISKTSVDSRMCLSSFNCHRDHDNPLYFAQFDRDILKFHIPQWKFDELCDALLVSTEKDFENKKDVIFNFISTFYYKTRDFYMLQGYWTTLLTQIDNCPEYKDKLDLIKSMHNDLTDKTFPGESWYRHTPVLLDLQLSLQSKCFLVSSFLASYLPEKVDMRLFFLSEQKQGSKRSKKTTFAQFRKGPQFVPLQRVLAVYKAASFEVSPESIPYTQISSLIESNMISARTKSSKEQKTLFAVGLMARADEGFEGMVLRCNLSFETVKQIAMNIHFDEFEQYLDCASESQ